MGRRIQAEWERDRIGNFGKRKEGKERRKGSEVSSRKVGKGVKYRERK